jgi:hypothetical protein
MPLLVTERVPVSRSLPPKGADGPGWPTVTEDSESLTRPEFGDVTEGSGPETMGGAPKRETLTLWPEAPGLTAETSAPDGPMDARLPMPRASRTVSDDRQLLCPLGQWRRRIM